MKRREFLMTAAAATGLAGTARVWAQGANQARLDRVAIMSLGFDGILKTGVGAPPDPARTLDIMDFPQLIADRYGVRRVELQHAHVLSTDADYLKQLRDRIAKAKSQLLPEWRRRSACAPSAVVGISHCSYDPAKYNLASAIKLAKDAGYKGLYSIETGGSDPHAAVRTVLDELLKVI